MHKFLFALWPLLFSAYLVESQATFLQGKVSDEQEVLVGATVKLMQGGKIVKGIITDLQGEFICAVEPGSYDLEITYTCLLSRRIERMEMLPGIINSIDVLLSPSLVFKNYNFGCSRSIPMIRVDETSSGQTFTADQLRRMY